MRGSIFKKSGKGKPRWYAKYKDRSGKWQMVPTHQPTKPLAYKWLEAQPELGDGFGDGAISDPNKAPLFEVLAEKWCAGLKNRSAETDKMQITKHVIPAFRGRRLAQITLPSVMGWIDDMRAKGEIAEPTQRHTLNYLSRFFSWAVERGHTSTNPVRMIPTGKRPRQSPRSDQPWLDDDDVVRVLIGKLPEPLNLMFYVGNQSGLRTGEIAGLRLSDLGFLGDGSIRVRFSYDGPLKEDKDCSGKVKWVPAPADAIAFLAPWIERRKAEGAAPEDLVFLAPEGGMMGKMGLGRNWRLATGRRKSLRSTVDEPVSDENPADAALAKVGKLTWYQATRHSFVSRNLSRGATLDEVSSAVGHSSPVVTRRYYDHFVRKTFSPTMTKGLGLGSQKTEEK